MEEEQGESRAAMMPNDARADRQDAVSSQAKEEAWPLSLPSVEGKP